MVLAAVAAAAMSTIDSGLNCSATVLLVDFYKRYVNPQVSDQASLRCLRVTTVVWGLLGTGFAILMIRAQTPWISGGRSRASSAGAFSACSC